MYNCTTQPDPPRALRLRSLRAICRSPSAYKIVEAALAVSALFLRRRALSIFVGRQDGMAPVQRLDLDHFRKVLVLVVVLEYVSPGSFGNEGELVGFDSDDLAVFFMQALDPLCYMPGAHIIRIRECRCSSQFHACVLCQRMQV